MMHLMQFLPFAMAILGASFFQGITGFGYAVISMPILVHLASQQTIVSVMSIISIILSSYLFAVNPCKQVRAMVKPLMLGGIVGVPLGLVVLFLVPPSLIKMSVGFLAIVFSIILMVRSVHFPKLHIAPFWAGLLTGLLQSSIAMSAPPVVLYLENQQVQTNERRRILSMLFVVLGLCTFISLVVSGLMTIQNFFTGLALVPFALTGGWMGNKVAGKVSPRLFQVMSLALLIFGGVYTIVTSVPLFSSDILTAFVR